MLLSRWPVSNLHFEPSFPNWILSNDFLEDLKKKKMTLFYSNNLSIKEDCGSTGTIFFVAKGWIFSFILFQEQLKHHRRCPCYRKTATKMSDFQKERFWWHGKTGLFNAFFSLLLKRNGNKKVAFLKKVSYDIWRQVYLKLFNFLFHKNAAFIKKKVSCDIYTKTGWFKTLFSLFLKQTATKMSQHSKTKVCYDTWIKVHLINALFGMFSKQVWGKKEKKTFQNKNRLTTKHISLAKLYELHYKHEA